MKKIIIHNLFLFTFFCVVSASYAQTYDDRCFIAQISNGTPQAEIDSVLGLYNLYIEDGPTTAFNDQFALVCVDTILGWPDSIDFGDNEEGDINGVIISTSTSGDENNNIFDIAGLNYNISQLPSPTGVVSLQYHHPLAECGINAFSINTTFGGNKAKIGILDTGIKLGTNTVLDDFFDPYDLGVNIIDNTALPIDDNGHGTHMASSITLATPQNLSSVVQLQAYKTHDITGIASVWGLIKGIDEAIHAKVQIISMSNSYIETHDHRFSSPPLHAAIKEAGDIAGILFVTSAGNNGVDNDDPNELSSYPASFLLDNILAVTAVDCKYEIPAWANTGSSSVDIAAPGTNIWGLNHNNEFVQMNGTSNAAKFVSRVTAMIASQQAIFDYEEVKCAIINGANQILNVPNATLSGGYLDAATAQSIFDTGSACSGTPISLETPNLNVNDLEASIKDGATLSVNATKEQTANLRVFNTLGQVVYFQKIVLQQGQNNFDLDIPTNNAPFTTYICHLQYDGKSETLKFIR